MNKKIPLKNIIPIEYPKKEDEWKIHLASKEPSTNTEPLDEFLKNPDIMLEWNRSKKPNGEDKKTGKKKYSIKWHKYIFHLVRFYPEEDTWLFVGIYKVISNSNPVNHEIELTTQAQEYIGRLKIHFPYAK